MGRRKTPTKQRKTKNEKLEESETNQNQNDDENENQNDDENQNQNQNINENQSERNEWKEIECETLKIITCNVASLASAWNKGFLDYVNYDKPDIICIQETKLHKGSKTPIQNFILNEYFGYFYNSEEKKGYAGTAIYTKIKPISVQPGFKDNEGRVIQMEFTNFYLVNSYVPMAGMKLERKDYKVNTWNPKIGNLLNELCKTKPAVWCGDLNVAHMPIDIYDTKGKDKVAGYTPEERKWFDDFLKQGYIDVFRYMYPDKQQFSFYSYRFNAKAKNHGWRLDYFVMPKYAIDDNLAVNCSILSTNFSDHSPVVLLLNREKVLTENDKPVEESGIQILNSNTIFTKSNTEENQESTEDKNDNEENQGNVENKNDKEENDESIENGKDKEESETKNSNEDIKEKKKQNENKKVSSKKG